MIMSLDHDPVPPEHVHTSGFTRTNTNAALREAFRVLAKPEQLAVLTNIVVTEAAIVAKQVLSSFGLEFTDLTTPRISIV